MGVIDIQRGASSAFLLIVTLLLTIIIILAVSAALFLPSLPSGIKLAPISPALTNKIVYAKPDTGDLWQISPDGTEGQKWIDNPDQTVTIQPSQIQLFKSPSGKKLLYQTTGQLYVMESTSSALREYRPDQDEGLNPYQVVMKWHLIDTSTRAASPFYARQGIVGQPRWSGDEQLLAFSYLTVAGDEESQWSVIVVNRKGDVINIINPQDFSGLTHLPPERILNFDWIDRDRLMIEVYSTDGVAFGHSLMIVKYDGNQKKLFGHYLSAGTMLPGGRMVIYSKDNPDWKGVATPELRASQGIFVSNLSGSQERRVKEKEDFLGTDGVEKIIVLSDDLVGVIHCGFVCQNASIHGHLIKLSTGEVIQLPKQTGTLNVVTLVGWNKTASRLLFYVNNGPDEIPTMSLFDTETKQEIELVENGYAPVWIQ